MSKTPDHPFTDAARGVRLQKVLAEAGVASRRACEDLIESGEVVVNGLAVTDLPAWVDPRRDRITVGGRKVRTSAPPVYVMYFKTRGVVCTNSDPAGRLRAVDCVDHPSGVRLFPVGRLDVESSGLILLTNDGELANLLVHPSHGIRKVYEVTVDGRLEEAEIKKLERGIFLDDRRTGHGVKARSRLRLLKRDRDRTRLIMELREGRNRQIRRMLADVGHKVRKLRRVQIGPLKLAGLRPGQWRDLTPPELAALKRAAESGTAKRARKPAAPKPGTSRGERGRPIR